MEIFSFLLCKYLSGISSFFLLGPVLKNIYSLALYRKKFSDLWSYPRSDIFSYVSLRNFMVLSFKFRSMIYFELIIVNTAKYGSKYIFFYINMQSFYHNLLERLPFSTTFPLHVCQKSVVYAYVGLILDFYSFPLMSCVLLCLLVLPCQYHTCSDY